MCGARTVAHIWPCTTNAARMVPLISTHFNFGPEQCTCVCQIVCMLLWLMTDRVCVLRCVLHRYKLKINNMHAITFILICFAMRASGIPVAPTIASYFKYSWSGAV